MWEIWANQLLPKAFKSCPKSNKSPNLVTLVGDDNWTQEKHLRFFHGSCHLNVSLDCELDRKLKKIARGWQNFNMLPLTIVKWTNRFQA